MSDRASSRHRDYISFAVRDVVFLSVLFLWKHVHAERRVVEKKMRWHSSIIDHVRALSYPDAVTARQIFFFYIWALNT